MTWSGAQARTYDGAASAVAAAMTNGVEGDEVTVTVAGGTQTNAGAYTATAALAGGDADNYALPTEHTRAYTIHAKTLTADMITVAAGPYYFTGGAIELAVTVADGSPTILAPTDYDVAYTDNTAVGEAAKITVTAKSNYTGEVVSGFTIAYRPLPDGKTVADFLSTNTAPNAAGWYKEDITLSGKDGASVGTANTATGGVTLTDHTDSGVQTIYIKDAAGNIYAAEFSYKLDTLAPTMGAYEVSGNPTAWTKESAEITLSPSDETAGVATVTVVRGEVAYDVAAGEGGVYRFTAEQNGDYLATVTDAAGNETAHTIAVTKIDKTNPTLAWSAAIAAIDPMGWYGATAITADAADNSGEAPAVTVTAGGQTYDNGYTLNAVGVYPLAATAVDAAGNRTDISGITIRIEPAIDEFVGKVAPLGESSRYETLLAVKLWHDAQSATVRDRLTKNADSAAAYEKLDALLRANAADAARVQAEKIAAADTVEEIQAAWQAYQALPQEVAAALDAAAKAQLEQKVADATAVSNVFSQLARADVETTPYEQKAAAVDTYQKLTASQKALAETNGAATAQKARIEEELAAIDAALDLLKDIKKPYTPATKALITAVRDAYDDLTQAQQSAMPTAQKTRLDELEAMGQKAQAVQDILTALGDTYAQEMDADILAAKSAQNALTSDERSMVDGALVTKLNGLYSEREQRIREELASQQRVAQFIEQLYAVHSNPTHTIKDLEGLKAAHDRLSETELPVFESFNGGVEKGIYDGLMTNLTEALPVVGLLDAIDLETVTPESVEQIMTALDAYDGLSGEQRRLVDEAVGGKGGVLTGALAEVRNVREKIAAIPGHADGSDIGAGCADHAYETHRDAIEAARLAYERLSTLARKLMPPMDKVTLDAAYEGLMRYLKYYNTARADDTKVEIIGLSQSVQLPAESEHMALTSVSVTLVQGRPPVDVPTPSGKRELMSVDVKLLAKMFDDPAANTELDTPAATEQVQPLPGESVMVKLSLPGGQQQGELEIWHVKDDGGRTLVQDFWQVSEGEERFICFEVSSFSHFVFYEQAPSGSAPDAVPAPELVPTEHGAVSLQPQILHRGAKVTITPKPDAGYVVGKVTVTDASGKALTVTETEDGRYTYTQPNSKVYITVTFTPDASEIAQLPFTDVTAQDWFYESVCYVYENGLMLGTSGNRFSPEQSTQRGMIATILWRMEQQPEVASDTVFDDVQQGSYYYDGVLWAQEQGIVTGYGDGTYGPEDPVTREQLAAILWRYAKYKGYDVSAGENTNILSYQDFDQISKYAIPALQWACGAQLMTGRDGGVLDPLGDATRAELAAMLHRLAQSTQADR